MNIKSNPKLIDSPRRTAKIKRNIHKLESGGWGIADYRVARTKRDAIARIESEKHLRLHLAYYLYARACTVVCGWRTIRRLRRQRAA